MKKIMAVCAVLSVLIMIYSFSGCKSNKNPDSADNTVNGTATTTPTSTVSPTATATTTPDSSSHSIGFESGVAGWTAAGQNVTAIIQNTSIYHSGAASLEMDICLTPSASGAEVDYSYAADPLDLNGKTVSFWLYVTADMAANGSSLYFMFGESSQGIGNISQGLTIPSTAGWCQFSVNLTGAITSYVTGIKFGLEKNGAGAYYYCGPLIVDDIAW
jgi:hypothetical protein